MKKVIRTLFFTVTLLVIALTLNAQDIHKLASKGDLEKIKSLIETNDQLINKKDNEGDIPLCTSIVNKHTELSLFFIEKGADIHNQNKDGFTPLHFAAIMGDATISKALIEKGVDLNIKTKSNHTALHYAAASGNVGVVKLLVDNNAALEILNNYQRTPLIKAAREDGGIETVKILVEGGANINAIDFFGDTALSLAAWRGFEEIVNYLLEKNVQFSTSGEEGIKLLTYASDKRLWKFYNALIKNGGDKYLSDIKKRPVLHWAAAGGSDKIVEDLINKGFQVNSTDAFNWAPLQYASYFGRLEAVKLLIDNGAEIDFQTPIGESSLYLARLQNKSEIIDFLISAGADQTPLGPTQLTGKYMGQKDPGMHLELFAPGIVSRLKGGHSNITFSPDGTEAFWTEWILSDIGYSRGCTIWHSKIKDGVWTLPEMFLSKGDTPFFSTDGSKIFLLSTFSTSEENEVKGIWYFERKGDLFEGPTYLNFDVDRTGLYWQFSFDKHENLYFSTDDGLFRSIKKGGEYLEKENLSRIFNPDYIGGSPFISPDGDYIIFGSMELADSFGGGDLYIGFRNSDGTWTKPINMGPVINSESNETLPMVSSDGKHLFLRTERNGIRGIYWTSAKIIEELKSKNY